MVDEGEADTFMFFGLGFNRKHGVGLDARDANVLLSMFSLSFFGDGNDNDKLRVGDTRDALVGKNIGTCSTGVDALLGKKWHPRFAIGVGGGDSESKDENTSELSGEWMDTLIVLLEGYVWTILFWWKLVGGSTARW